MIIDMVHAVAVVTVTLGTVAELHIGIVGIGLAAYSAFVDITLFLIGCFGGLLEIHRLG